MGRERRVYYRVVSLEELADIRASGILRAGVNSAEGKYLTATLGEAKRFAGKLYPGREWAVVRVRVRRGMGGRFFEIGRMDLCGRAWFAEIEDLEGCIIEEVTR